MTRSDELIDRLVSDLSPLRPYAFLKRIIWVTAVGIAGSTVALGASFALRTGVNNVTTAAFLIKFSYTASVMVMMIIALAQVAQPGGKIRREVSVLATIFGALLLIATAQLAVSPVAAYPGLILGHSSLICPFLIMGFGGPAFCLNLWFLRQATPTRPKLAGFIAGACAGAIGAWVYSWACVENGFAFIAIWYSLGIALSGLVGALCGPVCLRW